MSTNQYPTNSIVAPDDNVLGPQINKLLDLVPQYSTSFHEFKDLGRSYGLSNTSSSLRWELTYEGLDSTQAGVLDTHYASVKGIYTGFQFRHPRTGTLYTDVHYAEEMEVDHEKTWIQSRKVILTKTPV